MKSFLLFGITLLLAIPRLGIAQTFTIKGDVRSEDGAIPYANIELRNLSDSVKQYAISDSLGSYAFRTKKPGDYIIKASRLNFGDYISDTLHIGAGNENRTLNIILIRKETALQQVTVTAKKQLFETDKGKLVYNVQNSALTAGQTAFDLLKNLPGVIIGQNDEIQFRGSAGINVMIDGKMTYLSGNQLSNYLKGMSAEDLNKIELITTPPAEYDAAGNAGIINIIPKKNQKQGYAVDLRTSISKGKFWMNNQNVAASFRAKKWNVNGMLDFKTPHSYMLSKSGNTINDNGNLIQLVRENDNSYKIKYYTWRFGTEWQFLPKHKLGLNYHGYFDDFGSFKHSDVKKYDNAGNLQSLIRSGVEIIEPYHYDAVNLNYRFDIDSLGKKITADAHYTSYRNFSDAVLRTKNYTAGGTFINEDLLRSHQPGFVKIKSVQSDADLPFRKFILKAGLKYAEAANDNKYRYDSLQAGNYVEAQSMTNHFKYSERIAAVYLSGAKKMGKTSIEAGLRLEHTNAKGYTVKQDISNNWLYTKLFPSLAVEQTLSENNKIDFSVSKRINRPSYTELNPVRWYSDQYFYYSGNPNLLPEIAWVYNINYSFYQKYIFTVSWNQSNNYINRRLVIDDNGTTIKSQSDNFGSRKRFDLTISAPVKLLSFWDVQAFANINYTSYPISQLTGDKLLSKWSAMYSLQQNFVLPKGFKMNVAAYYYTSELRGIYKTKPAGWIDFGIKKSFYGNKLDAQFSINDVLNTNRYRASSLSNISNYYYDDKPYSRIFGLSFRYHFGGDLIKAANKKTEEQERL